MALGVLFYMPSDASHGMTVTSILAHVAYTFIAKDKTRDNGSPIMSTKIADRTIAADDVTMDLVFTYNAFKGSNGPARLDEMIKYAAASAVDPERAGGASDTPTHERRGSTSMKTRFGDEKSVFEEMTYSLKAAEMHGSFFRHIWVIVADTQDVPTWITDHKRVKIVRHGDILPRGSALPTYDIFAIESAMHRILTLSERFLYCNDDQLFGARTSTSDFIDAKGRVKVWTWKSETDSWQSLGSEGQRKQIEQLRAGGSTTDGWRAGQQNALQMSKKTGPSQIASMHQCRALRVSTLYAAESKFPEAYQHMRSKRFRSVSDFAPQILAANMCINEGKCVVAQNPSSSLLHGKFFEAPRFSQWAMDLKHGNF